MTKIYQIVHFYTEDGGFGDAVGREEIIGCFSDETVANEYVARWSNQIVYDKPYDELVCGKLSVVPVEIDTLDINVKPSLGKWFDNYLSDI